MILGKSAGPWLCATALVAALGGVGESRAELRDLGPCEVGTVVKSGQYCSHKKGDNDFRFSVEDREACIAGSLAVSDFSRSGDNVKLRIDNLRMNVPETCAGSGELRLLDFVAREGSGRWTVRSLPRSASPTKDKKPPSAAWQAPWADRAFPQIDYSAPVFRKAHKEGHRISGWWIVSREQAGTDVALATNVSAVKGLAGFPAILRILCREGKLTVLFSPGGIVSKFHAPLVTYRFGDGPAVDVAWRHTSNSKNIGIDGSEALDFIRRIRSHEDSGLSIGVRKRSHEKLREKTFSLLGAQVMVRAIAERCSGLGE